jgi:hypothetical protein
MAKYIKGKDGKFKGSLPDAVSVPKRTTSNALPKIPNKSNTGSSSQDSKESTPVEANNILGFDSEYLRNFYQQRERDKIEEAIIVPEYLSLPNLDTEFEDAYVEYEEKDYMVSLHSKAAPAIKGIAGVDMGENNNGKYSASVYSIYGDASSPLEIAEFDSLDESTVWLKKEINKRTHIISTFNNIVENDEAGLTKTIEARLTEIGREYLVPINNDNYYPNYYADIELPEINGLQIIVEPGKFGRGAIVYIGQTKDSRLVPQHIYYGKNARKAVLFGLFITLAKNRESN